LQLPFKVIDFHAHLPYRYKKPEEAGAYLVSIWTRSALRRLL
jgi:hypothetical protein